MKLFPTSLSLIIAAASLSFSNAQVLAADDPIAKATDYPLVHRRTTLIVRDINASLALYRDVMGMEVIYDEEINRPRAGSEREQRLRLIFLKASHDYVGVIGLIDYEYGYPDHPAHTKPLRREGFTPGNAILLFNTNDLETQWKAVERTPGVEVISAPKLTLYPGYGDKPDIAVMVSKFYDPDGYIVELNEIIKE